MVELVEKSPWELELEVVSEEANAGFAACEGHDLSRAGGLGDVLGEGDEGGGGEGEPLGAGHGVGAATGVGECADLTDGSRDDGVTLGV